MADEFKRHTAYKVKIGDVLNGNHIIDGEKLRFIEVNGKNIARVNLIANIVDKYVQNDEKKFASMTLDDASGQIKLKTFGEEIEKFSFGPAVPMVKACQLFPSPPALSIQSPLLGFSL